MADIEVVMDKLQGFETADDLAEFFQGYGIKAVPRDGRMCAITQFVWEETGIETITTNYTGVHQYVEGVDGIERYEGFYSHTNAMITFIHNYDRGEYPFLVKDGFKANPYDESLGSS